MVLHRRCDQVDEFNGENIISNRYIRRHPVYLILAKQVLSITSLRQIELGVSPDTDVKK